jgi:hypothetical protein
MGAAEIHCELCTVVYGQKVMSEGTERQWYKMYKAGQTNVHVEEPSRWPSALSDNQKICER